MKGDNSRQNIRGGRNGTKHNQGQLTALRGSVAPAPHVDCQLPVLKLTRLFLLYLKFNLF